MANVSHSALTGSDLHELKGASSAAIDTVPVADGSGSTSFAKIDSANIDTSSIFNTNKFKLIAYMTDVAAAMSTYVVVPVAGTVSKIWSVTHGAITAADSTVTCRNHSGTSMGTITIAVATAAAKDVDSLTPSSNNTFTAGQVLTLESDGGASTTTAVTFVIELTQTA